DTQETERSRLARELHDGISQELLGVRFAMELAGRRTTDATADLKSAIDESVKALSNTIREIRSISHDLRPRALDDMGLTAAIQNLAEKFAARTGVELSLDMQQFIDDLVPPARTAIFRVAQEALNNVERHSKATRLQIKLWTEKGRARMQISDNGRGLGPKPAGQPEGLGLQNMRERIAHFGGLMIIDSADDGTNLLVMLPKSAGGDPSLIGKAA
ncbi:MAG: histidine kinase, partial [Rhizobium sp.]|uniref:sensor histidine kinase n=1 Tax=Rhizobium sp. TaxID=391 RepID=UPI0030F1760E